MHLKSILNRVERHKSFVYTQATFVERDGVEPCIEVQIEPRANGRPICSGCGKKRPGYDRLAARRFEFVPLWNIAVFFVYALRRVDCPKCGVTVERVPWAEGKEHLTTTYRWFLARWAKRLSWKETAVAFNTTWDNVFRAVKHAVLWGIAIVIFPGSRPSAWRKSSGAAATPPSRSSPRSAAPSVCLGSSTIAPHRACDASLRF
jgi:hypothetical protein